MIKLTAKELILLHLLEHAKHREAIEVPLTMTQDGISRAAEIDVPHFAQYVRPLIQEGLIRERTAHVKGVRRRRKVYDLTESGQLQCLKLRERVGDEVIRVHDETGIREANLARVLRESGGRISLLEVLHQAAQTGVVDLSQLGAPSTAFVEMLADAPKVRAFVGRNDELEVVTSEDDLPRIFVVRGVAGIGKSTLAAKACDLLRGRRNLFWRRVRAWDTAQSLLASLGDFLSNLGRPGLRSVLLRGEVARAAEVLRNDLPGTRSFLVFDDAHESMRETVPFLRLMKEVIAGVADVRALVLTRTALSFYDRRDVALEGVVLELDLAGLKPEEGKALLSDEAEAATFKITRALGGHPLLLELARAHPGTGSSRLREVRRFVEEEVYRKLSDPERKVMKTASLYRVPVPRDALLPDSGLPVEVLMLLMDRSLVVPVGEEGFEVHDTIRSAFVSFLTGAEREELGRFATTRLRELARTAQGNRNLVAAIDYLSNALEISEAKEDRAPILEELGDVTERTGDLSAALIAYKEALKSTTGSETLARLHRKTASALVTRGHMQAASEEADAALGILGETFGVERGFVELVRCRVATGIDEWEEGWELGETASHIFEVTGHLPGYAESLLELAHVRMHSPRRDFPQAERDLSTAMSLLGHLNDADFAAKVHSSLVHFYISHVPNVDRAREHLMASEELIGPRTDPQARFDFLYAKGKFESDLMAEHEEAEVVLTEALSLARKTYATSAVAEARFSLALTRFFRGRFDLAKHELDQLTAEVSEAGLAASRWGSNYLHWLYTTELIYLLDGDIPGLERVAARVDDPRLSRSREVNRCQAYILQGIGCLLKADGAAAVAAFQQAVQEGDMTSTPILVFHSSFLYGATLKAMDRDQEGATYADRARDLVHRAGFRSWESLLPEWERRAVENIRRLLKSQ